MKELAPVSEHGREKLGESDRMNWNSASVVSLLTGVFAVAASGSARAAATPGCAPVAVVADAALQERWPDLPAQIRETFQARADVDPCARIELASAGAAVGLRVILPDGRTATRSVSRREDVLPALEALLLLPDAGAGDSRGAPQSAPPPRTEPEGSPANDRAIVLAAAPAPSTDRPAPFRIELALAAEARAGTGWLGAGAGVASFLDIAHWLVGFQGRIDRYQSPATGAHAVALELIALGGHRFGLGRSCTLDLAGGPALALHGSTTLVVQMTSTGITRSQTSSNEGLPRVVLGSRLTFGRQSLLRTFVQVDADIGRPGSGTAPSPDEAGLPAWTVGLALGATLGTR